MLIEPTQPVFFHHFPYRDEGATRRRLERLSGVSGGGNRIAADPDHPVADHMRMRMRSLDAVYRQRWDDVAFFPGCTPGYRPELRRFDESVGPGDAEVARWYSS